MVGDTVEFNSVLAFICYTVKECSILELNDCKYILLTLHTNNVTNETEASEDKDNIPFIQLSLVRPTDWEAFSLYFKDQNLQHQQMSVYARESQLKHIEMQANCTLYLASFSDFQK